MTVASRVAVMDHGKLIQVATPAEIYEAPDSVYVADFIGDVNILRGNARPDKKERLEVHWAEAEKPIIAGSREQLAEGSDVAVAIRPEKIAISASKPKDAVNAFQGKVLDIAYLGNISTYHVELSGGQVIKAQTANSRRIGRRSFTWEDTVWLSFSESAGVVLSR